MKSLRREYPLSTLLELIGMPRSTYYYHEASPPSDRQATERPAIVEICEKSQFRYGYRRVADTLRKATGIRIADKTVLKVMREEGLLCRTRRRRKYRSYMGQVGKSSPNLPARDFEAEGPMTKLVTDVTEFKVGGTKLYLSPVVDLYNDEVVAYSISRSPNMKMVLEMLAGLEGRLDGEDAPLLHSDMGWQYQMPAYRLALERMGDRPVHVPQRKLPRQREGRKLLLDGQDRALLRLGGRRPRYLREGFGEVHRLVQQRAHQETPGRKQPGRVQAQPGCLIHFFCRSGNGVLCRNGRQFTMAPAFQLLLVSPFALRG